MPSFWSRVDRHVHADAKFRSLSPIPPCGQGLWLYLLTAPESTPIPGLIAAGQLALAESLGWLPEAFREAFREVFQQGLAEADWKARLVWLPNAIRYNFPESPNVILGWARYAELLPECELRTKAFRALGRFFEEDAKRRAAEKSASESTDKRDPEAYLKAFRKAFPEAFTEGLPEVARAREARVPARDEEVREGVVEREEVPTPPPPPALFPLPQSKPVRAASVKRERVKEDPMEGFEEFYAAFPRKKQPDDAAKAWRQTAAKRPPLPEVLKAILRSIAEWDEEGRPVDKRPYPGRWLRAGSYRDGVDIPATPAKPKPPADEPPDRLGPEGRAKFARNDEFRKRFMKLLSERGCPPGYVRIDLIDEFEGYCHRINVDHTEDMERLIALVDRRVSIDATPGLPFSPSHPPPSGNGKLQGHAKEATQWPS